MLASLYVCVEARSWHQTSFFASPHLIFGGSLSLNPKLINLLACLSNKSQDPLSLPPCSFQCKDYRHAGTLDCLCGCWGSEHRSSGLCSEQFNHRAISICPGFNINLVMFWALHSLWILSGTFPYYCPFDTFRRTVLFQVLSSPQGCQILRTAWYSLVYLSQHFIRSLDQTVPSVSWSACPSDLSKDRDYLNLFSPPLTIFIPVSVGVIELSALGKRLTRAYRREKK